MTMQSQHEILILGVESSCDDTAAAVVKLGGAADVLSSVVWGQEEAHAPYGGVVPEIAARAHATHLDGVTAKALADAGVRIDKIDLLAATAGPGLIGGVMSGLTFAKGIAVARNVPLVPVNHLAGHALSVGLEHAVAFPYLLLLVSGGHTQLLLVDSATVFRRLGTTIDDAAGEAFDKTAKLLGLEGAGGPAIERAAAMAGEKAQAFDLPRPLLQRPGCDFSFSGMKTAVRTLVSEHSPLTATLVGEIAASFQFAAVRHLTARTDRALSTLADEGIQPTALVAAGGVAANSHLRDELRKISEGAGIRLLLPSLRYCTDNAAMIAYAGGLQVRATDGRVLDNSLAFAPRPRWPLDPRTQGVTLGSGRKGRKA